MTFCSFSRTKERNDILLIQQDYGYGMTFWSFSRTKVVECHFSSFSRTEVMKCLFVHSAGLRLWNDILFINQD